MYKIRILSIGKTKESWLDEAINEYLKRLQPVSDITFIIAKSNEQLMDFISKEKNILCLDSEGEMLDSKQFSNFFLKQLEDGGSRLSLVIGGAEGLPAVLKQRYPAVSLSKMTLTHQMARLLLIEQIYRAFEIAKGSNYHK